MTVTQEMQKNINKLKYDNFGKWDSVSYTSCSKIYFRERLNVEEMLHISSLDDERKAHLLNFINLCNPDISKNISVNNEEMLRGA
jgi:hypothetical protein